MNQYKTCSKCGQFLSIDNFYKDSQKKSGYRPDCKGCVLARVKTYGLENSEQIALKSRLWYEANKQRAADRQKDYRKRNAKNLTIYFREYRERNKESISDYLKIYYRSNKDKYLDLGRKRRARLRNASLYLVTPKDIKKILSRPCTYCGKKSEHVDHVIPLIRGGNHSVGNLTGACASCNLSKNSKLVMEWRRGRK